MPGFPDCLVVSTVFHKHIFYLCSQKLPTYVPSHWGEGWGGHVFFGVDAISWRDRWILTKLAQTHHWIGRKKMIRFWWFGPYFQGHWMWKNVGKCFVCTISPEWMDEFEPNLHHWEMIKNQLYLATLTSFSRSQNLRSKNVENCHVCTISLEWMDGFYPNLHIYITERCKTFLYVGDHDLISMVTLGPAVVLTISCEW